MAARHLSNVMEQESTTVLPQSESRGAIAVSPARQCDPFPMPFQSILFARPDARAQTLETPDFFRDLNLDQIVDAVTSGRDEYDLKPFFYTRLTDLAAITYRHEIMRDLESDILLHSLKSFSERMLTMREHLTDARKLYYKYQRERALVSAVTVYGSALESLLCDLDSATFNSRGLATFRAYLAQYIESSSHKRLLKEAEAVKAGLAAIRYYITLNGLTVAVRNYEGEIDYSADVEATFDKFKQGVVKDYRFRFPLSSGMNHVDAQILDLVAKLNPDAFAALDAFFAVHQDFADRTILNFDREIHFYISYLEYIAKLKAAGLRFCYPIVSDSSKEVLSLAGFDLALASKLVGEKSPVVCNDFRLEGAERISVVTGPNQGGKTTFARTFGQLHYLASLGCPVPGTDARLFLFDRLFTHFEREEDIATLHGKLQDDLVRIHSILEQATPKSVVVMNEIFASTTLQDAIYLGKKVIERLSELDALSVCVTFMDELASLNAKTVSMVATIVPENPTLRTYRIERMPADGLSYAVALAEKYRLTFERIDERIAL